MPSYTQSRQSRHARSCSYSPCYSWQWVVASPPVRVCPFWLLGFSGLLDSQTLEGSADHHPLFPRIRKCSCLMGDYRRDFHQNCYHLGSLKLVFSMQPLFVQLISAPYFSVRQFFTPSPSYLITIFFQSHVASVSLSMTIVVSTTMHDDQMQIDLIVVKKCSWPQTDFYGYFCPEYAANYSSGKLLWWSKPVPILLYSIIVSFVRLQYCHYSYDDYALSQCLRCDG